MIVRSLIASLALVSAAGPALAQDTVNVAVSISDLDLSQPTDRERFEVRLKSAARDACRTGYHSPGARVAEQRCVEEVIATAQQKLD